jgi:hypothetical protein
MASPHGPSHGVPARLSRLRRCRESPPAGGRAERLLPLSLADHGLEVGVALEIAQWLGPQSGSGTRDN